MKKWHHPCMTTVSSEHLSKLVYAHARSIKCELCYVR